MSSSAAVLADFKVHRGDPVSFSLVADSESDEEQDKVLDSTGHLASVFDFGPFQKKMLGFVRMMPAVQIAQKHCLESMYRRLVHYFHKMEKMQLAFRSLKSALEVYEENSSQFDKFVQQVASTKRGLFLNLEFTRAQLTRRSNQLSENRRMYNRSLTRLFDMITQQEDIANSKGLFNATQQSQLAADKNAEEVKLGQIGILKVYTEQMWKNWAKWEHAAMAKVQQQKLKVGFMVRVVEKIVASLIQAQWKMKKRRDTERRRSRLQRMSVLAVSKTASERERKAAAAEIKMMEDEKAAEQDANGGEAVVDDDDDDDDDGMQNALKALMHVQEEVDHSRRLANTTVGCQTDPVVLKKSTAKRRKSSVSAKKKKKASSGTAPPAFPRADSFLAMVEAEEARTYNAQGGELFSNTIHAHVTSTVASSDDAEAATGAAKESDESLPYEVWPPPMVAAYQEEKQKGQQLHRTQLELEKDKLSAAVSTAHLRIQEYNTGSLVTRKGRRGVHRRSRSVGHTHAATPLLAEMRAMLSMHSVREEEEEKEKDGKPVHDIGEGEGEGEVEAKQPEEFKPQDDPLFSENPESVLMVETMMDYFFFVNEEKSKAGRKLAKLSQHRRKKLKRVFPKVYDSLVLHLKHQEEESGEEEVVTQQEYSANKDALLNTLEKDVWQHADNLHELSSPVDGKPAAFIRFPSEHRLSGELSLVSPLSSPFRQSSVAVVGIDKNNEEAGVDDAVLLSPSAAHTGGGSQVDAASTGFTRVSPKPDDAAPLPTEASVSVLVSAEKKKKDASNAANAASLSAVRVAAYRKFEGSDAEERDDGEEGADEDSAMASLLHHRLERKLSIQEQNLANYGDSLSDIHPDISFYGYKSKEDLLHVISTRQHEKDLMLLEITDQQSTIGRLQKEVLRLSSSAPASSELHLEARPQQPAAKASFDIQRHFKLKQQLQDEANANRLTRGLTVDSMGHRVLPHVAIQGGGVDMVSFSSHHHQRLERAEMDLFDLRREYDDCVSHLQHYVEEADALREQVATGSARGSKGLGGKKSTNSAEKYYLSCTEDVLLAAENDQLAKANSEFQSEMGIIKAQVHKLGKALDHHKMHSIRSRGRRGSVAAGAAASRSHSRRGSTATSHKSPHKSSPSGGKKKHSRVSSDVADVQATYTTEEFLTLERETILFRQSKEVLERSHMENQVKVARLTREVHKLRLRLAAAERGDASASADVQDDGSALEGKYNQLTGHVHTPEIRVGSQPVSTVSVAVLPSPGETGETAQQESAPMAAGKDKRPELVPFRYKKRMPFSYDKLEKLRADRRRKEEEAQRESARTYSLRAAEQTMRDLADSESLPLDWSRDNTDLAASAGAYLRYGRESASRGMQRRLEIGDEPSTARRDLFAQRPVTADDDAGAQLPDGVSQDDGTIFLSPSSYRRRIMGSLDKSMVDGALTMEDMLFGEHLAHADAHKQTQRVERPALLAPCPHPSELARLRAQEKKKREIQPRNMDTVQRAVYERRRAATPVTRGGHSSTLRTSLGGGSGFRLGAATKTTLVGFGGLSHSVHSVNQRAVNIAPAPAGLGNISWTPRPRTAPSLAPVDVVQLAVPSRPSVSTTTIQAGGRALRARQKQTKEMASKYKLTRHRWEPEKVKIAEKSESQRNNSGSMTL